jgi:methyltransferase (TIGR00027 family)
MTGRSDPAAASGTSESRLDALAISAWWSVAARAQESSRSDALFVDRWALALIGADGRRGVARSLSGQGPGNTHVQAVTTRFFDEFLAQGVDATEVEQVVLVASGLDARAFRLRWPPNTHVFELDQPSLMAFKRTMLPLIDGAPRCEWHTIGVNLNEEWMASLCEAGFNPSRRSIWLLEGGLYFLAEPAVLRLLESVTSLAAPGSRLGFDIVNRETLTSPLTRPRVETMAAKGAPWLFTSDEPEDLLARFGWAATVVQPGEGAADFGRHPYPLTPRSIQGMPRALLVTATRVLGEGRVRTVASIG